MNGRVYLITDAIFPIVETILRLPTEKLLKECRQECNLNFITNSWARLTTRFWWTSPILSVIPKQHRITLRPL